MGKKYVKFYESNCPYESGKHLTEGKAYEVVDFGINHDLVKINDDRGMRISVYMPDSSHTSSEWVYCDKNGVEIGNQSSSEAVELKKYVRPAMTQEARDILNSIHETVGAETRSDSIVEFMNRNTEMEVELCARKQEVNELEYKCDTWKDKFFRTKKHLADSELASLEWKSKFVSEKLKHKGWIIYSAIVAAYAVGVSVYCLIGG